MGRFRHLRIFERDAAASSKSQVSPGRYLSDESSKRFSQKNRAQRVLLSEIPEALSLPGARRREVIKLYLQLAQYSNGRGAAAVARRSNNPSEASLAWTSILILQSIRGTLLISYTFLAHIISHLVGHFIKFLFIGAAGMQN